MTHAGMNTIALRDARGAQWTKLIFNASTNPVGALTLLHHGGATRFGPTGKLFDDLMTEGEQVAKALSIELHGDPRQLVQKAALAPGKHPSSMLQDVLAKRQTEVDFMNGAIVRWGEQVRRAHTPQTGHSGSSSRDWSTPGPTRPEPLLFANYYRSPTPVTVPFNIGVLQLSMEPVQETVAMAKACEDAGFDTFWIAEAYPWWRKHSFEARSSTAVLAVIAQETKRMQLGWGIISPYTRHPVEIAMEARVMQDLCRRSLSPWSGRFQNLHEGNREGEGEKLGPAAVMRESVRNHQRSPRG